MGVFYYSSFICTSAYAYVFKSRSIAGVLFDSVGRFRSCLLLCTTCMRSCCNWIANCVVAYQTKTKTKPLVCVPVVNGGLVLWRHNKPKPKNQWCGQVISMYWFNTFVSVLPMNTHIPCSNDNVEFCMHLTFQYVCFLTTSLSVSNPIT